MAIIKVDPLREFAVMQDRMNRLFGNVYLRDEDTGFRGSWVPAVDIYETDKHDLVLRAELPGMSRENIEVTVENSTLIIKGEKNFDPEVKEENYRRALLRHGPSVVHAAEHRRHSEGDCGREERRADHHAAVQGRGKTAHDQRGSGLTATSPQEWPKA